MRCGKHSTKQTLTSRDEEEVFTAVHQDRIAALLDTLEVLADPKAIEMLRDSVADIWAGRMIDHDQVRPMLGDGPA